MFRIPIPNWVHFIITEYDGSIWGYRYEPKQTDEINKKSKYNSVKTTEVHKGRIEIIAITDPGNVKPCTIKVPAIINRKTPYLGDNQTITTSEGEDYKDYTFKEFLLDQNKKK